jgi:glycine oxidase
VPENWNAKKAFQLESLLMAEDFWANVESTGGGRSGYARNGRLQPIADGHALVLAHRRADTARALWQQNATWEIVPATDTPWEPASPSGWIIRDSLSGLIHPKGACMALVQALAVKGVRVDAEGPDLGQVLWATGVAGLLDMTANHSRAVGNGVKGQAALLAYDARGLPQLFAGGVHVIPHGDGTVAVGSTSERDYTSPNLTDTQLDDVISAARSAVPALDDAPVIARWAGVRPRSRSRAPMLGPWPGKSGHFIANGGFKIGFGMAPKIAEVMADLMLEARDTIPDGFRIEDNF